MATGKTREAYVTPHTVAVGEVTHDAAVVWAHVPAGEHLHVTLSSGATRRIVAGPVNPHTHTGRVHLTDLEPDTPYAVAVVSSFDAHPRLHRKAKLARFRTAPPSDAPRSLSFAWSADLGGQNVCRHRVHGYPIFRVLARQSLHFWMGLGDMIYADHVCQPENPWGDPQHPTAQHPARTEEDFLARWAYNRADRAHRHLLSRWPYFALMDDHEVVNDAGPRHDSPAGEPTVHLMRRGVDAFFAHNPITRDSRGSVTHRTIRWGAHLEALLLDTRQHRDANSATDTQGQRKTMLGEEQLAWLERKMVASNATWLAIVSSVPITIATGSSAAERGRDGWSPGNTSTGFQRELDHLVDVMARTGRKRVLWFTADVHFASHIEHSPRAGLQIHQFSAGPLSAGVDQRPALDKTLNPKLRFFHGLQPGQSVRNYDHATELMNFGRVHITSDGVLQVSFINAKGKALYDWSAAP